MKALSLQQPYTSAILDGPKRVENRPRRMGLREGMWVWVHASQRFYFNTGAEWVQALREMRKLWPDAPEYSDTYQRGVILGAMLCGETYDYSGQADPWTFGPVCTEILVVVKLSEAYPCKGKLGLWTPPSELEDRLRLNIIQPHLLQHLTMEQREALMVQLAEGVV